MASARSCSVVEKHQACNLRHAVRQVLWSRMFTSSPISSISLLRLQYFGTMAGVRNIADPNYQINNGGGDVFAQWVTLRAHVKALPNTNSRKTAPDANNQVGTVLPWHSSYLGPSQSDAAQCWLEVMSAGPIHTPHGKMEKTTSGPRETVLAAWLTSREMISLSISLLQNFGLLEMCTKWVDYPCYSRCNWKMSVKESVMSSIDSNCAF